jgi:hypothetical protein
MLKAEGQKQSLQRALSFRLLAFSLKNAGHHYIKGEAFKKDTKGFA